MEQEKIVFCRGGGCTAKLGPAVLQRVLSKLPPPEDPNLLIGTESSDDAAVYRLSDDIAFVQTLDFFPPMVEDPRLFGQIAAANALSDVYAMGGKVRTALNIVCFPEDMKLDVLGEILRGGAEKVREAGGVLAGGHSIADKEVKYGLSVTGTIHPDHIRRNNTGHAGDLLILTKPLGVGLICSAERVGQAPPGAMEAAVASMTTLNRWAAEAAETVGEAIHACTDVTGFGLLGHLAEMLRPAISARIFAGRIPALPGALQAADDCLYTAAAQRTRNHLAGRVRWQHVDFAMQELLLDPQTSGGLLFAVDPEAAPALQQVCRERGVFCAVIGELLPRMETDIIVEG